MAKSGEVLSQNQIDSILTAISSGSTTVQTIQEHDPEQNVRSYDFKHPSKFSREHVQSLQAIHEMYARLLSTQLTTQMRLPVQTEVISLDQLTYDEFMRSITNPTVVLIYRMSPLKGTILFEFTPGTAISIIERLLGGPGRIPAKPHALTDVEQSLMSNVFNRGMASFREAWKSLVPDLRPVLQNLETNPRFVQVAGPGDSVLVISFELRLGDSTGSMRICLPYPTIESLLPHLSRQYFMNTGTRSEEEKQSFNDEVKSHLNDVEMRLALILGHSDIHLQDLLELEQGDVIELNTSVNHELSLSVERNIKFKAKAGRVGQKMAAEITQVLDEGQN